MSTQKLFDILPEQYVTRIVGKRNVEVKDLTLDSREVKPGTAFIAKKGYHLDGHAFIGQAIEKGANVIFCEELPDNENETITYINYRVAEEFVGKLAHAFFGYPSKHLKLIGVTGTNGKSSIVTMLHSFLHQNGHKSGLLSTIENRIGNEVLQAKLTTPDPVSLNRMLQRMVREECDYACMEVSSHALDQGRVAGLDFSTAIFTNITHDHLDYHKTMTAYIAAKKKLFDQLKPDSVAIINADDRNGKKMMENSGARSVYYGLQHSCDYKGRLMDDTMQGMLLEINGKEAHFSLSGEFNAYNLLAVFAVAAEEGMNHDDILISLSAMRGAEGRFEKVMGRKMNIVGIVDYAHTPDALQKVIFTIKATKDKNARIIVVVGCGGDRDKAKRPVMAAMAVRLSDIAILTSDNPRNEDPEVILDDMEKGLDKEDLDDYLRISDRRQAIRTACKLAKDHDVILVAGKGHEKYQEIKGEKFPFDDKKILENELL